MPSTIQDTVFKEPTGGILALVHLIGALLLIGQYGYNAITANFSSNFALFLGAGWGLAGIAESLPTHRRRAAGVLRLAAIVVQISLFAAIVFAPELFGL